MLIIMYPWLLYVYTCRSRPVVNLTVSLGSVPDPFSINLDNTRRWAYLSISSCVAFVWCKFLHLNYLILFQHWFSSVFQLHWSRPGIYTQYVIAIALVYCWVDCIYLLSAFTINTVWKLKTKLCTGRKDCCVYLFSYLHAILPYSVA